MRAALLSFVLFFLASLAAYAAEGAGFATGFVERDIWFSQEKLTEGDAVRIYTAIFNGNDGTLSGTMAFYDNETVLGKKEFSVAAKNVGTVSIAWNVTAGSHIIHAEITDPAVTVSGTRQSIFIEDGKSDEEKFTVSKKIPTETPAGESGTDTPSPAAKFIEDHVPEIIATPVLTTTGAIDDWRGDTAETLEKKKEEQKEVVKALKDEPIIEAKIALTKDGDVSVAPDENKLKKPLENVKLFLYTIGTYIFTHKALFYVLVGALTLLIIRFAWKRIL